MYSTGECDHIAKYLCEALEWPLEPLRDESSAFSRSNDSFAKGKDVKGIAGTNSQSAQPTDERDMNGINRDSGPSLVLKRTRATRHSATSSDLKKDLSEVSMESIVTKLEHTEVQRPPSDYCRTNSSRGLNDCFEGMSKRTKVVKGTPLLAPVIMLESVASSSSGAPSALPPSSSSSADSQSNIDSADCWDCTSSAERIFNIKPRLNISTVKWLPPKNYGLLAVDTVLAADVLHESTKCSRKKRDRLDEKMIPVQKNISPRSKIQRSCDPSKLTGNKKAQLAIPIRAAYAVKVTTSGNRLSRMSQQKEQGPNTSRPSPCLAEDAVATSRGKRKVPIPGEKEPVVMKRSRGTRRMEEESTECSNIAAVDHKVEKSALGDFDGTTTKRKRGRPRKMPT